MPLLSGPASTGAAEQPLRWEQTNHTLALLRGEHILWKLHADPAEGKPYFHPLATASGQALTDLRPDDHPWHRGVWWSWKFLNGLNYWEEDRETGLSEGRTTLVKCTLAPLPDFGARIEMELTYHPPGKDPVLSEARKIVVSAPETDGSYTMDWRSTFTVLADTLEFSRTPPPSEGGPGYGGYAGWSVRRSRATADWAYLDSEGRTSTEEVHGHPARWVACQGSFPDGSEGCVAIYDHPGNLRHPTHWYATQGGMPYFSPAILFPETLTLKQSDALSLAYRLRVSASAMDAPAHEAEFKAFADTLRTR